MPELPEVETIKNTLANEIIGEKIEKVEIYHEKMLQNVTVNIFKMAVSGGVIKQVNRRGKYLLIDLYKPLVEHQENCGASFGEDMVLVIHLRMTGRLILKTKQEDHSHLRCRLTLSSSRSIDFIDQRKFGTLALLPKGEENNWKGLKNLGPEPLGETFSLDYFREIMAKKNKTIKQVLLDQELVAGIGNIYADEILFQARVHPSRVVSTLADHEIASIYRAIRMVMEKGILYRGTTFSDYRDSYGDKGLYQDYLKVYKRNGKDCLRCGSVIHKTKIADRGTCYCPECQNL